MRRETVVLLTGNGRHEILAEIADTPPSRALGLMFRRQLDANHGMLFLYDRPQPVSMWMRNTYISLDMVFIRKDGVIGRIVSNTEPLSETSISAGEPVVAVLELKAGAAAAMGLRSGDRVEHRFFLAAQP
jgi:uncharacterized membrane protein (UPF0127 family)